MTIRTGVVSLVLTAMTGLCLALVPGPQDPQLANTAPKALPGPVVSLIGADSKIEKPRVVKVSTAAEWATLWHEHTGQPQREGEYGWYYNPAKVPVIDFEQCMLVAVFQGKTWNSAGVHVVELLADAKQMTVRFDDKSYQTAGPDGGGQRATPFGIFVLPKRDGAIVLEENVQGLIGQPAKWRQRATL